MASSTNFNASSTSYVTMGAFTGLDNATELSISYWINFNTVSNNVGILGQYTSFSKKTWYIDIGSNTLNLILSKDSSGTSNTIIVGSNDTIGTLFTSGNWYHICYTWKYNLNAFTDFTLYIDGVLKTLVNKFNTGNCTNIGVATVDYELGALNPNFYPIDAKISYVEIFDRELSSSEVQEIMNKPGSIAKNRVSYLPLYDSAKTDLVTGDKADVVGANATLDPSGPPVYFPDIN